MSTPCACRDCMDAATATGDATVALCLPCEDAGCTAHQELPGFMTGYGLNECQREDAYQEHEGEWADDTRPVYPAPDDFS